MQRQTNASSIRSSATITIASIVTNAKSMMNHVSEVDGSASIILIIIGYFLSIENKLRFPVAIL